MLRGTRQTHRDRANRRVQRSSTRAYRSSRARSPERSCRCRLSRCGIPGCERGVHQAAEPQFSIRHGPSGRRYSGSRKLGRRRGKGAPLYSWGTRSQLRMRQTAQKQQRPVRASSPCLLLSRSEMRRKTRRDRVLTQITAFWTTCPPPSTAAFAHEGAVSSCWRQLAAFCRWTPCRTLAGDRRCRLQIRDCRDYFLADDLQSLMRSTRGTLPMTVWIPIPGDITFYCAIAAVMSWQRPGKLGRPARHPAYLKVG